MQPTDIDHIRGLGEEIAADLGEKFGSEHLALAMDKILFGAAYNDGNPDHVDLLTGEVSEPDPLEVKIEKLVERARIYNKYDRYLASEGMQGNPEVDAAIKRIAVLDAHKSEFKATAETVEKARQINNLRYLSFMCKTSGLFLGREVLNRDFTFFTHGPLFDFFVQKDPYKTIPQQDLIHKIRLLQMPRGSFKSVSDGIDCVQWIVTFPDIRIMFLTASLTLAKDFVGEIKNYFTVDTDAGEPTPFQFIFAQDERLERPNRPKLSFLVNEGKEGKENEFICPARTKGDQKKKEVTIWAGSVGAGKVGKHCHLIKADDAVDEKNTDTPKLITKTKKRIGMASKLVDPGGYKDNLGTPYAPNDWYNHIRLDVKNVLTLIRPAKWPKIDINGNTALQRGVSILGHEVHSLKDFAEVDWTLLFPCDKYGDPKLSHEQLRSNEEEDPEGFPSQYMLDPHGYKKVSFTEELISRQTITKDMLPSQIEPFACYALWDLADTQGTASDYTVGVIMWVDREGRGYVVDLIRDRFTFGEMCYQIAKTNHDYKPIRIIIENARGAEKLRGDMVRASQDLGDKSIPLEFIKVSNVKSAKSIRIGKLEPRLKDRMLFFLNSIPHYEELLTEFRDFGSAPHDDIPDAIGFSEHVLPAVRTAPLDPQAAAAARRILEQKQFDEMIYQSSPEQYVDVPVEHLPEMEVGGTGNDTAGDLWNPFGAGSFK